MKRIMAPDGSGGEGNTNPPPQKKMRSFASKYWVFTYFKAEIEDIEQVKKCLGSKGSKFLFGLETCPTTGKKHLQGFIQARDKIRPMEAFPEMEGAHWEKCKAGENKNVRYCRKDGQVHTNMEDFVEDPLAGLELYPWQQELKDLVAGKPEKRKIYWYWESKGNIGKTDFAKSLCISSENVIYVGGKASDIKHGIIEMKKKVGVFPRTVIWDIVRSLEEYVSYQALEEIKNGIFFSGKFESGMCLYNTPHVIVFANFAPETSKLSADRWVIKEI
nr:MAG: replication associated protein [Cressdnaviricota sp.]